MYADIVIKFLLISGVCSSIGNRSRSTSFAWSTTVTEIGLPTELPASTVKLPGGKTNDEIFVPSFDKAILDNGPEANVTNENSQLGYGVSETALEKEFLGERATEILSYAEETGPGQSIIFSKVAAGGRNVSAKNDNSSNVYTRNEENTLDLDIQETAGFAVIGVLVLAVVGYIGFVLWRRYLQNKYDNQTLISEDAYDISDLKYLEI